MRRLYRIVIIGLLLCTLLGVVLWKISSSRTFQLFGDIVPKVTTSSRIIALTFDDGPTHGYTDSILAILEEANVTATFFVTGGELEANPVEGRKIVAAGHEIGNHTWSHERMVLVSQAFIRQEIERTDSLIRRAGYTGVIHFRPPYGKKLVGLPWYLSQTNRKTIMWNVEPDSYDDVAADPNRIVEYVAAETGPGSIIILHVMYPSRSTSMKAVRGIIERLQKQGYRFVTVSQLLAAAERI